jgi:hypothetical protein
VDQSEAAGADPRALEEGRWSEKAVERVTSIDQLHPGDDILWCREIKTRPAGAGRYYDPDTAAVYDVKPIGLRRGTVLSFERENKIVRLRQRRQRIPLRLVWAVERY